jgi:hypothetical protein
MPAVLVAIPCAADDVLPSRNDGPAKKARFKRLYTELIYQPQLELLAYLRANGFKAFIVSGGGIAFMRPFTAKAYGIPPEQVVAWGSSFITPMRAASMPTTARAMSARWTRPSSRQTASHV